MSIGARLGPRMHQYFKKSNVYLFVLLLFLISADQATKYLVFRHSGFFICNQNLAWGINLMPAFFWSIWAVFFIILLLLLKQKKFQQVRIFLLLILAGAAANFIDRLIFGCVIDFINLGFWPLFNLADIFITAGVIFLLAKIIKS